ncbi:MAG: von Willebrand factor type A domain-containing protein, partial [Planctomycetaceae bacterium]|nr:von Willebrand factor type A domain-containing protein [Planctomycetaceae bacterium]
MTFSKVFQLSLFLLLMAVLLGCGKSAQVQCTNNLKLIGLALHSYHDQYRCFPPAITADENGKPLHSWRVLLLPYIENRELFESIRLDEPWDSDYNKQFHDRMPSVYRCPSVPEGKTGMTGYSVVVGKESYSNVPNAVQSFGMIMDGTSNTIAVVERKTPVCWMDPTLEITFGTACMGINVSAEGLGSNHKGGMNICLFDGSVNFISQTVDSGVLHAMFTWAGGESATSLDMAPMGMPQLAMNVSESLADEDFVPLDFNTESYDHVVDNPFLEVKQNPLSTFSIDVDTASYSNLRRLLNQGTLPPKGAVRIEEMVNYFDYNYEPPKDEHPFSAHVEIAPCPWEEKHQLARVGLKGKVFEKTERPTVNLVFLIDVSGSMQPPNKLPLLKSAMTMLVKELQDRDRVAIVTYAGSSGLVLPSTTCD